MTNWDELLNHKKQKLTLGGADLIVEEGVFTPDPNMSYSASIIINNLPFLKGLDVIDVGTGSGVIAVAMAIRGASNVIATDISDKAVNNAQKNIRLNDVEDKVVVVKTNLLKGVEEKFDLICANLPILDEVWNTNTGSVLENFLIQARGSLKAGGKIFLSWGSFVNNNPEALFKRCEYKFEKFTENHLGHEWYLYVLEKK